ncbi:serine/threonine-protein kinase Nek5-like [Haliotis rufescens]|uniref:serine/threonine-protein kinase Nek5-like n=1 Tax=Haliotis rufescens TaxID=6454 RepID=UPI00201ED04E|nr:serine/threonine-protein kinase Nek5-like [Haliotis rufescens]
MDKYETIKRLGSGACGAVYLVRHKDTKRLFALKKIDLDERRKTRTKEAVIKEARILEKLKHPHIVAFQESFCDEVEECLVIIQDYCDGGTIEDKIREATKEKKYFEEKQIMEWFLQIVMGVQYFHSKKILHRDLKTENIFLTKKNVVKIGDFGISKTLDSTIDVAKTVVGTPTYLSPELCQDIPYNSKSDIWALGCVLYELCALCTPFDAPNILSLFYKIVKAEFVPPPSRYTQQLRELVKLLLAKTPEDRPSASAILNLPYVQTHLGDFIQEKETLFQQRSVRDTLSQSLLADSPGSKDKLLSPPSDKSSSGPSPRVSRRATDSQKSPSHQPEAALTYRPGNRPEGEDKAEYSDDFDESSSSEIEEDIQEVPEAKDGSESEADYADDFEEYDSSQDLEELVHQAREARDVEARDDYFEESMNSSTLSEASLLKKHYLEDLGGGLLGDVTAMMEDTQTDNPD